MVDYFQSCTPVFQALLGGLFTWLITAIGATTVFFSRTVNKRLLDSMLGFAAGVMLAASYWSLLAPAIEISERGTLPAWIIPASGFIGGGALIWLLDRIIPHLHPDLPIEQAEGPKTSWRRSVLLVSAITIHNIPERERRSGDVLPDGRIYLYDDSGCGSVLSCQQTTACGDGRIRTPDRCGLRKKIGSRRPQTVWWAGT